VIGRSYGGTIAVDLALRYPELVRALVLLEADAPSLSLEAARWLDDLTERVYADGGSAMETVLRAVAGETAWEELPDEARGIFSANGPAVVAELRGGFPEFAAGQLATIDQPTLLVVAEGSLQPGYPEIAAAMAAAMPSARVETVEGGHLIAPAHPVVLGFVDEVLGCV
jgi:pimeloyl-ACP methyl ester carboxylesterase